VDAVIKLSSPATREFWEVPVVFEDDHLLGLSKPPGLLTSPDRSDPTRPNLMRLLHDAIAEGKSWATKRGLAYLMNAHRLDCETSGVLLLAKSKPALIQLANLFGSERPLKTYVTLVRGAPEKDAFEVDAPLARHPAQPGFIRIDRRHGKASHTRFEVAERFDGFTLLRCHPRIERSHQIRAHLRSVRLPVAGDVLYGGAPLLLSQLKPDYRLKFGRTERPLIGSAAVHAERLELLHPVTGQPVAMTAEWPKDLSVAVKYLRRYAPLNPRHPAADPGQAQDPA
jgi:23S rRNA pseudouridine1911/1915/1917 synthase